MRFKEIDVTNAPLIVDAIYEGGNLHGSDPIQKLLPGVANQGGIRKAVAQDGSTSFVTLQMTGKKKAWPDFFDSSSGICFYFGDNKDSEKDLLDTPGNKELVRIFSRNLDSEISRTESPPIFLFENPDGEPGKTAKFVGLAVPGSPEPRHEWCFPRRFVSVESTFWNLVVAVTVLAVQTVSKDWISSLQNGSPLNEHCPDWYRHWVKTGERVALTKSSIC